MKDRRVVITGMGAVSPVGNDVGTFWSNLKEGRSGISTISSIDIGDNRCKIAGEVRDFEAGQYFKNAKDARRADRYSQLAIAAGKMAFDDAAIDLEKVDRFRFGVMVGSGIGGLSTLEREHSNLIEKGPGRVNPFLIPMMIANISSGMISMEYGLGGPNMSIVTACATANHNIGEAWRMIKFGDADIFLAGGSEASVTPIGLAGFSSMRALSFRNDEPERASRPFDVDRDGFVMGEGAGVIVIEEYEHAKARGADIYAELVGYGVSADAYHLTSPLPEGEGASRCIDMALGHAGLNPEDVDYVNAHGTSTGLGDICETKAIKRSFGEHAKNGLVVSSTKSMTGHALGAAGSQEAIFTILMMQHGFIAPNINLEDPDEMVGDLPVVKTTQEAEIKYAISNSFGFGGTNCSLIFAKEPM